MKIDLHMHTHHSDGELSVPDLLALAQQKQMDIIAITDHSTMAAYQVLNSINIRQFFTGKLISGVELYSFYDGKVVEILSYGANTKQMHAFCEQVYGKQWEEDKKAEVTNQLKNKALQLGLTINRDYTAPNTGMGECGSFFRHLKTFPENRAILGEALWTGKQNFFRDVVNNVSSPFYVDYSRFYLTPEQIATFVHSCGGKAFLAHTYVYGFDNELPLLNAMLQSGVDGIECYYPTFSAEQCQTLLTFCQKHNLLISAGSDYHGAYRSGEIGLTNPHLPINAKHLSWVHQLEAINQTQSNGLKLF